MKYACKCGSDSFLKSFRVRGPWVRLETADGILEETNVDALEFTKEPKKVKCAQCGALVPNPDYGSDAKTPNQ